MENGLVPVNYVAVVAAAVVGMVAGYLWYGPLFGKVWMKEMGFKSDKMEDAAKQGMGKTYGLMFVGLLFMAYILAHAEVFAGTYMGTKGPVLGLTTGFFNWLGFVVPVSMGTVLWDGKSWKLWKINSGYYLVTMLAMGVLLSVWV